MPEPSIQIKRKVPEIKQLPEEKKTLKSVHSQLEKIIDESSNFDLQSKEIVKIIQVKQIYIIQIANEFDKVCTEYQSTKDLIQILYLIDFLCKSSAVQEIFISNIREHIVQVFETVFKNQRQLRRDLNPLKITFKSWWGIFPESYLVKISKKILKEHQYNLDQLSDQQLRDIKRFYEKSKNPKHANYEDFLNGKYIIKQKIKREEPSLNKKIQMQQPVPTSAHPSTLSYDCNPHYPKVSPQSSLNPQQTPMPQLISNQPHYFTPHTTYSSQTYIPQSLYGYTQVQVPVQVQQPNLRQNPPIKPQNPPPAPSTNPPPTILPHGWDFHIEPSKDSIFGPLFKLYCEQVDKKLEFQQLTTKEVAKDFLRRTAKQETKLLFFPNNYGILMKCPTCFMRFRNQKMYMSHLTSHATRRLDRLRDGASANQINCTIDVSGDLNQQWLQSGYESEETVEQKSAANHVLELEQLQNTECHFCLEKFKGQWDSVNCKWIYENVINFRIVSNDLDEPQIQSIHTKCSELLNLFNK